MSSVIASHIPNTITIEKLQDFFSFCGDIKSINLLEEQDKFNKYEVNFEHEKALSTAMLLDQGELDGVKIKVEENSELPQYKDVPKNDDVSEASDNKIQANKVTGDDNYDEVEQEEKPKYAIMAQMLAQGYGISDEVIEKSIKFDQEHGYSAKFKSFLTKLDDKFIHLNDPESKSNKVLTDLKSGNNKYYNKFSKYLEKASNHPYGMKVHDFYKTLANDVKEVHKEAKRLNELKSQQEVEAKAEADATTKPSEKN